MMKLFLSSSGLQPEFKQEFLQFLGKDPKQTRVAFIATAADPEENKTFVKWSTDQTEEAGMSWFEVDLRGNNSEQLKNELAPADIIWVNGGNTFYLLDQVRKVVLQKSFGNYYKVGKYITVSPPARIWPARQ